MVFSFNCSTSSLVAGFSLNFCAMVFRKFDFLVCGTGTLGYEYESDVGDSGIFL
jgi:hypothetical protein